jgi:hypothetical protein
MAGQRRRRTTVSVRERERPESAVTLHICGESLAIAGLPGELRERFSALMRPFAAEFDPATATHQIEVRRQDGEMAIVRDSKIVASYGDPILLLTQLEWHTVTTALEATETYLPVHGAALTRDGATVLLLAESGGGKTTLTLGLMGRGWQPLADDIVLIDAETLAIQPFPRCFHVDDSTRSLTMNEALVEWPGTVQGYTRPLQWADSPQRPRTILLVERCPSCPSRLHGVTLAEVAAAIGNNSIRGRLPRSQVAQIAVRLATGASAGGRLRNGHLDNALDLIESVSQK